MAWRKESSIRNVTMSRHLTADFPAKTQGSAMKQFWERNYVRGRALGTVIITALLLLYRKRGLPCSVRRIRLLCRLVALGR